jgi:hypothetical protein
MNSKGSIWRKWDFHLHTPFSILHNEFGNPLEEKTWSEYVNAVKGSKKDELSAVPSLITLLLRAIKKSLS